MGIFLRDLCVYNATSFFSELLLREVFLSPSALFHSTVFRRMGTASISLHDSPAYLSVSLRVRQERVDCCSVFSACTLMRLFGLWPPFLPRLASRFQSLSLSGAAFHGQRCHFRGCLPLASPVFPPLTCGRVVPGRSRAFFRLSGLASLGGPRWLSVGPLRRTWTTRGRIFPVCS